MGKYIEILNSVLENSDNIKDYSTEEIVDAANRFSIEGDNGRAIFLCRVAIAHTQLQYEKILFSAGEELIMLYLHKGSYEDLLGLYDEGFSSFAKAVQIARDIYEFVAPSDRVKYISLCYHFIAVHYLRLEETENAVDCYEFISRLLEGFTDDVVNNVLLNKAYSHLISLYSDANKIGKVVEYKRKIEILEKNENNEH